MRLDASRATLLRYVSVGLFGLGMLFSAGAAGTGVEIRWLSAIIGLVVPFLTAKVWGERTRPRNSAWWWLLGLILLGGLVAVGQIVLAASLLVGAFVVHDHRMTPSLMIVGGVAAVLVIFEPNPGSAWVTKGWWTAFTVLSVTSGAIVERDRLAERDQPPTPLAWTAFRIGFLSLWTVTIVPAREYLETGRFFAWFGADPTGDEGLIFLTGVLLASLVLAALFLRSKRKPVEGTPAR